MTKDRLQRPKPPRRSQRINPYFNPLSVLGTDTENTIVRNRNFAREKKRTRTESVPVLQPKSGSPHPADSGHKSENVNGKQRLRRAAAAAPTIQGVEVLTKSVNRPSVINKATKNRRNKSVTAIKDWKKTQKPSSPNYFINTRSTRRSELAISYSNSASSYYNQLCNEELVIPTKPTCRNTTKSSTDHNKLTERYKKVARRTSKRPSSSIRKRVLFENILAYEYKDTVENSTSEEEATVEEEAEQVVPLVPRKSFFESSVEDFCQLHPVFEKATERCLKRLGLVRSAFSMNSPVSPSTPAPTMVAVSSTGIYQSHLSPTVLTTHSGKRKHPEDTNDHNYPQVQSTTPPGPNTQQQHPNKQLLHPNSSNQTNHFRLSPRSWIFQTPDKQKLGKLPPPSTIRDEDDDTLTVPVMIHHSKRLKTVYSFDESTVVGIVGGAGAGGSEVQIDSDRLSPICQITTADDGADCEFEANSSIDDVTLTSSTSTNGTSTTIGRCEEQNQFQLQQHELSLDFGTTTVVGKQHRLVGGGGGDGEVAFLDQWVRMNSGASSSGSGDHSPLRILQTNQHQHHHRIPQTAAPSRYFSQPPLAQAQVNDHLRNIHNVATQRPTKSLPRYDRRQYLERKSLTFEETISSADTPKATGISAMIGGKLRALKQKAASADSISDGGGSGSGGGGRKRSTDLFNVGRGEIMRDLRDIAETVTSGAYEHEQENIPPSSHMGLLLGNLQMNDSVDISYDRPLFPRRNY